MKAAKNVSSLAELTTAILDPLMRKKAGLNIALLENWPHIVGEDYAENSLPLKIVWPHRQSEIADFEPGTLVVACEGFAALKLAHESTQILSRINGFFGYHAVARIKILQQPITGTPSRPRVKTDISAQEKQRLQEMTAGIHDEKLREALIALGENIFMETGEYNKKNNK